MKGRPISCKEDISAIRGLQDLDILLGPCHFCVPQSRIACSIFHQIRLEMGYTFSMNFPPNMALAL